MSAQTLQFLQCVAKAIIMVFLHYVTLSQVRKCKLGVCITACDRCLDSRSLYRSSSSSRIDLKISWCCLQQLLQACQPFCPGCYVLFKMQLQWSSNTVRRHTRIQVSRLHTCMQISHLRLITNQNCSYTPNKNQCCKLETTKQYSSKLRLLYSSHSCQPMKARERSENTFICQTPKKKCIKAKQKEEKIVSHSQVVHCKLLAILLIVHLVSQSEVITRSHLYVPVQFLLACTAKAKAHPKHSQSSYHSPNQN